jgi:hypothetical protein
MFVCLSGQGTVKPCKMTQLWRRGACDGSSSMKVVSDRVQCCSMCWTLIPALLCLVARGDSQERVAACLSAEEKKELVEKLKDAVDA